MYPQTLDELLNLLVDEAYAVTDHRPMLDTVGCHESFRASDISFCLVIQTTDRLRRGHSRI